ncbi:Hypothetical protein, putative [Bodo saltans]|uniref:Uncharacterized protein n=1 Tax=Bodo saltans TaxID=75058 RepID=A0A0S4JFW2_BODSA|nr:Hypothetical protein, putative [Bodo saltans]|eukprot:CUG88086.1 Hypothetical protein, putative [Bodo saltans]
MGQGYPTKERQQYIPAEPVSFDDAPLYTDEDLERAEQRQQQQAQANRGDHHKRDHFSNSARRASKADDPRSNSLGQRPPGDPNSKTAHNDGEWMYNLDSLANEHAKKKRKSVAE